MTIAWSCGGGIQSVAIGVLIGRGELPIPDHAGIVDTGRERRTTWEYLDGVLNPYLRAAKGIEVERIRCGVPDLHAGNGDMLLPAYTTMGRLPAFCSGTWKRDEFQRWLRRRGVKAATMWLGFSLDEQRRVKKAHRPWLQVAYPLIDKRLTRQACGLLIERAGLPLPRKSRCWMCPHQNAAEWAEVRADPQEWAAAVQLDRDIREADQASDVFLHLGRVPLELADLTVREETSLFSPCEGVGCWT